MGYCFMNTVKKYFPNPVFVRAIQWDGTSFGIVNIKLAFPECSIEILPMPLVQTDKSIKFDNVFYIKTSDGKREIKPGCFVVKDSKEKYKIMKENDFNEIYHEEIPAREIPNV